MTTTTFVSGTTIASAWLNDVNTATYNAASGSTGAVARSTIAKLADMVSVKDFGALGDGSTNDAAAIQAAATYAVSVGKALYFPAPTSFYKITTAIRMSGTNRWFGENGVSTIIRNTAGGTVITCDSTGSLGPYIIENMRIGGSGGIGITATPTSFNGTIVGTALTVNSGLVGGIEVGGTVSGTGVTANTTIVSGSGTSWVVSINQAAGPTTMTMSNQYVAHLKLRNVHFEGDLLTGIDANLIFTNWDDVSFGYYLQTAYNAGFICLKATGNGVLNANLNSVKRTRFYGATGYAVQLSAGILWRFEECDWEGNVRNLSALNVTGLELINCYTERNTPGAATSHCFDFSTTVGGRVRVRGGWFDCSTLIAGNAVFGVSNTTDLIVEDAVITTGAAAFAYYNTSAVSNSPYDVLATKNHHFKDCSISGNASDVLSFISGVMEDTATSFTPVNNGLTIVNGTGGVTWSGTWSIRNRVVFVTMKATLTGTATVANGAVNVNYLTLPSVIPLPRVNSTAVAFNEIGGSLGNGLVSTNGRLYPPAFVAQQGNIDITTTYMI